MRLNWNDINGRVYETGLDRGVLYPPAGNAVVWNGMTSVSESGQEGQTSYYIDGQPFLHLPTRKEFKASIRAYTYPDEFTSVMGLEEATDGFYVDSQGGLAFDLSYRTLVGDGARGTELGYKIHLIYNATVATGDTEHATIGSEISPIDFEWQINAVPEKLDGFHPSAHYIIDTRHLDGARLAAIEALIYGDDDTTPQRLPKPDDIFELLRFGDGVIVVDNGDGTWTATGKYVNVVENRDGTFVLNNVDVNYLSDGVYYFGDTPPDGSGGSSTNYDGGTPSASSNVTVEGGTPSAAGTTTFDGGGP